MCILLGCVAACILFYIAYELISVIGEDFTVIGGVICIIMGILTLAWSFKLQNNVKSHTTEVACFHTCFSGGMDSLTEDTVITPQLHAV